MREFKSLFQECVFMLAPFGMWMMLVSVATVLVNILCKSTTRQLNYRERENARRII